jgi:hypothetical protein
VNKKNQKNFTTLGQRLRRRQRHTQTPEEQKFFGSFFQKRTAFSSALPQNFYPSGYPHSLISLPHQIKKLAVCADFSGGLREGKEPRGAG